MSDGLPYAIERWYGSLWSEGDLNVADEIISPEYDPDWIHIPKKGPEQVKHEIRYFRSIFPDLTYKLIDHITDAHKVWVRYKASGTQDGSAWGFPATGKQVSFEGAAIFWLDQTGQIVNRWGAFSFYDVLTDLELVPPLWELNDCLNQ